MAENKNRRFFENDTLITSFVPTDLTDVGQGTLLYEAYHHKLRYCEGVGWIVYGEGTWTQSETGAQGYSQRLTDLQMQEAEAMQMAEIKASNAISSNFQNFAVM